MRRARTIIHINAHKIRSNAKNGTREPVITVKRGKTNTYGHEVVIRDDEGREVARVIYRPDKPLSCGARVWLTTELNVEVITTDAAQGAG